MNQEQFNQQISKEAEQLMKKPLAVFKPIHRLIEQTKQKITKVVINLSTINPFTHIKSALVSDKDIDIQDSRSQEEFIKQHLEVLPKEEHQFYIKKYHDLDQQKLVLKSGTSDKIKEQSHKWDIELQGVNKSLHDTALAYIEQEEAEWYLSELEKIRNKYWEDLKKRIEELEKIEHVLKQFDETGIFWDLCQADLLNADISTLLQWSKILLENSNIKKLIDLIGRSISQKKIKRKEQTMLERKIPIVVNSLNSKEEIKSLELDNDLMRMIPQELLYLSDPDLEYLFYQKYTEKNLLCYHLEGQDIEYITEIHESEIEIEEEEQKGPIIVCVDTSGSMSGLPETIAKAVALSLASRAIKEDRACHIINFSMGIQTFTLDKTTGMQELISFLQMSFHGGTDVAPALIHAIEQLKTHSFKKADVLIVSDFIMGELSFELIEEIDTQKELGTKFFGLNIGSEEKKPSYLDKQWIYSSHDTQILELWETI
ncbi:MAG: VWA domain-containing protein [Brevinema sp.]